MAAKRRVAPYDQFTRPAAAEEQFAAVSSDLPWFSSADRLDFAFKKRTEKIDWRKIAAADADRIAQMVDFDALQDNIINITFCDIESELDLQHVDPNYVKLFRLAQMTIEYLLHSQEFLINKLDGSQKFLSSLNNELVQAKSAVANSQAELSAVKAESHKRKRIIAAQQLVLQNGTEGYNKCSYCAKAFINRTFLDAHIAKRHPSFSTAATVAVSQAPVVAAMPPSAVTVVAPSNEMEMIRERLRQAEQKLSRESEARVDVERQLRELTEANNQQLKKQMEMLQANMLAEHQVGLRRDVERYMRQQRETEEKLRLAEAALNSKISSRIEPQQYNFELLELRRQREEVALLKEELLAEKEALARDRAAMSNRRQSVQDHRMDLQDNDTTSRMLPELADTSVKRPRPTVEERPKRLKADSRDNEEIQQQVVPTTASVAPSVEPVEDFDNEVSDGEFDYSEEMTATHATGTLPTFDGTLSMTDKVVQDKIRQELQRNPQLLQLAREQVLNELDEALMQRGITKSTSSISEYRFKSITGNLDTERTKLAKDIKNFYDMRNQMMNVVDAQAKAKHRATTATPPMAPPRRTGQKQKDQQRQLPALQLSDPGPVSKGDATALSTGRSYTTADSMTFTGTTVSGSFDAEDDDSLDFQQQRDQSRPGAVAPPGNDSRSEEVSDWDDDTYSELEEAAKPVSSTPLRPTGPQGSSQLLSVPGGKTNGNSWQSSGDNDLSLKSVSSIEEAAAPKPALTQSKQPLSRSIIQSNGEPANSLTANSSLKGKKLRSSVTFSDELEEMLDD